MIESTPQDIVRDAATQFVREELSLDDAQIAAAVAAMLEAGGKRLRPRITLLGGQACGTGAPGDTLLAAYMELIHIATLIHDDVVDAADRRRGRDSTNYAYGNRFSVLAGDYLFAWVFKKITQGYASPIPTVLSAMLAEICNGEVKQLRAAGDLMLTKERYFEIIGKKTAELFASCAEVGALAALLHEGAPPAQRLRDDPRVRALRSFGWHFGMAFQIRDDLLDVVATADQLGKPAGSDLQERRVTLPLILALEAHDQPELRGLIEEYFAARGGSNAPILRRLRSGRCIDRAKGVIAAYVDGAEAALEPLPAAPARDELARFARNLTSFSS